MAKLESRYLYVIRCGDRLKIGIAVDCKKRLKTLQTGNADKLILEWSRERDDAAQVEAHLHRKFSKHRVGGEWFDGTQITVDEIIVASYNYIEYNW